MHGPLADAMGILAYVYVLDKRWMAATVPPCMSLASATLLGVTVETVSVTNVLHRLNTSRTSHTSSFLSDMVFYVDTWLE